MITSDYMTFRSMEFCTSLDVNESLLYRKDRFAVSQYRRSTVTDDDLNMIHSWWEQSLGRAAEQLPDIKYHESPRELIA